MSSTARDGDELAAASQLLGQHGALGTRSTDSSKPLLPLGIGYLCWMSDLDKVLADLTAWPVQAVWQYAWTDVG